jgi:hypothetical protein
MGTQVATPLESHAGVQPRAPAGHGGFGDILGYLDKASAAMFENDMEADPSLSYYRWWEAFRAQYVKDVRLTHRQAWRLVKLQAAKEQEPTLQERVEFQAHYLGK